MATLNGKEVDIGHESAIYVDSMPLIRGFLQAKRMK